jgi:hypothetical protein
LHDRRLLAAALAAAVAANVPGSARSAGEFALHFALGLLPLAAVLIFCLVFAKRNLLAYALAAWALALRGGAADLIGQPNPSTQMQGWLVVAVFAATLLWAGLAAGANRSQQLETPSA